MLRNPLFCSFDSLLIVSLTPFINNLDFSRDLTIFMISLISSLEIINVVIPEPNVFFQIAAFVADVADVNRKRYQNAFRYWFKHNFYFTICKPVFSNGLRNLSKIPPDCPLLDN